MPSLAPLINWSSEAWTNALEAVSKALFSRCHHSRACPSRMTCCAEIQSPEWSTTARAASGHATITDLSIAGLECQCVHCNKKPPLMSAWGQNRQKQCEPRWRLFPLFPQNRKCQCAAAERRFVPKADSCAAAKLTSLFDDFVRLARGRTRAYCVVSRRYYPGPPRRWTRCRGLRWSAGSLLRPSARCRGAGVVAPEQVRLAVCVEVAGCSDGPGGRDQTGRSAGGGYRAVHEIHRQARSHSGCTQRPGTWLHPTVALGAKAEAHERGTSNVTPYSQIIGRVLT